MTVHIATEGEAFWYAFNPFKRAVNTLCGTELENSTEVPEDCANCVACLSIYERSRLL